jgi:hypothetical protein
MGSLASRFTPTGPVLLKARLSENQRAPPVGRVRVEMPNGR